ncbi:hypothetical protein EAX61_13110 [Dokdonia sinensis]|uniref:DUF3108 domain-containing protein n=1 Tax=Dokdonia sinensis TaxID=2479847 RepID=A0A3M0FVD4_9FLAO|nr:hypothetical protein [Dokdonia sinensis]RMB56740.1 hypothetical protein EAX61_13110 [Dokdonia sinensis]
MKTVKILYLTIIAIAFTISANAQDCSTFYPFSEGVSWEITSYGKKGKIEAVTNYNVSQVRSEGSEEIATFQTKVSDKKGEVIVEGGYDVKCFGDTVSIDFKSLMNAMMAQQYGEMDVTFTGTDINLPNNLTVGQELDDADMKMNMNMGGIGMNINVAMTDRKVIAQESVTTPAGTFDCYVLTYTTNVKTVMSRSFSGKQWIAPGVGMVKQEDYNKKGKVTSSSELTAFSK